VTSIRIILETSIFYVKSYFLIGLPNSLGSKLFMPNPFPDGIVRFEPRISEPPLVTSQTLSYKGRSTRIKLYLPCTQMNYPLKS